MNGLMQGQVGALNPVVYSGMGQTAQANAGPRPLGYLEQLSGVVSGLDEIRARLDMLASRIAGTPVQDAKANRPAAAAGLPGLIQDAHDHIAGCRALLTGFEQSF